MLTSHRLASYRRWNAVTTEFHENCAVRRFSHIRTARTLLKEEEMEELIARAQRVVPVFDGERIRAIRELIGGVQADIAKQAGITPSALSQAERGVSNPSAATLLRIAQVLEVPVEALARRPASSRDLNPQFRHLRRTSQREKKRALRLVEATDAVIRTLSARVQLPDPFSYEHSVHPDYPIDGVGDRIEDIALETRHALGVDNGDPLDTALIELLENNGIVVVRDPDTDRDIDAYSAVVNRHPIVVLDGGSESVWDRDNFNLAHELGHLVMHRGIERQPGTRKAERQAHRFAGAFLAPQESIRSEIPTELDWNAYLDLKIRWGLSMAALVHRAHDLGIMGDAMYTRAMKQRSAYGWTRSEPGNDLRPLPQPSLLARAVEASKKSVAEVAGLAGIPVTVVERIVGTGPRPVVSV